MRYVRPAPLPRAHRYCVPILWSDFEAHARRVLGRVPSLDEKLGMNELAQLGYPDAAEQAARGYRE